MVLRVKIVVNDKLVFQVIAAQVIVHDIVRKVCRC